MRRFSDFFPRPYLAADDLNGSDVQVTIAAVDAVMMDQEEKDESGRVNKKKVKKCLLRFEDGFKPMVCNLTNGKRLRELFGDDVDGWVGQTITLYAPEVEAFGKTAPALRIRPQAIPSAPGERSTRTTTAPRRPAHRTRR